MSQAFRHKSLGLAVVVTALTLLAFLLQRAESPRDAARSPQKTDDANSDVTAATQSASNLSADLKTGRVLAEQVCGSCHIFPEPDIADRFTWANGILSRMSVWLGYDTVNWTNEPGGAEVLASGKVPNAPLIDLPTLKLIHDYYLSTAPLTPPPQINKPELKIGLKHFRVRKSPHRIGQPMTTLVKIDERSKLLLVGDGGTKKIEMLKPDGTLAGSFDMPNPIVHLLERPGGFYATMIGSVFHLTWQKVN